MEHVKKKDRRILIILMVFLGLITVGVAGYFILNAVSGHRQVADGQNKEYLIYWNADKETYMDIETGASTRQADKDKKFTLRFVHNGEVVEYRARSKKLVYQVDARDVMGLEIDEKGFITEVIDIEDFTGGYAAIDFFVESMDEEKLVANSSTYFSGEQLIIKAEDKVPIYDVSPQAKTLGEAATSANLQDRLTAVQDKTGNILQAFITERSGNDGVAVLCPHCNEEVQWKVWNSEIKVPSVNGHWKLTSDVNLQDQGRVAESNVVVLDLNGYTVYGNKDARIYCLDKLNGALNIVDLSSSKTGKLVSNGTVNAGSCVFVAHGIFEMYGGTLDASKTKSTANGTAVALSKDTTFNMYGGTIIGGTAQTTLKADLSGTSGGSGGSVNVAGVFQMYDGTIKDGKAKAYHDKEKNTYAGGMGGNVNVSSVGEFYMYGGEILNGVGQRGAGNVQICKGAKASMENGLLSGGVSEMDARHGGNLYIAPETVFTMTGGKIEKGIASGNGGNVICYGTLNLSGGSITGGQCLTKGKRNEESHSHNMYVYYGNLVMSGGLIDGYVHVNDSKDKQSTVTLSGTAKITGGKENLYLAGKLPIVVNTLKNGADIGVSAAGHFSEITAANNAVYFHSDYDRTEILHIDNKLFAGRKGCVCGQVAGMHAEGCSKEDVIWMPWMKSTSMPIDAGNYYLTCNVEMQVIQATIKADSTLALDLNGYTVLSAEGKRIYSTYLGGVTLSITDTSEKQTGCLKSNEIKEGDAGLCVWVSAKTGLKSQFNLYGGTLDASKSTSKANGCAVAVTTGCTFNMYGGKIIGGSTLGSGGSVFTKGDFVLYDGTITGGKAPNGGGGNVLVETGGSFTMKDGTVTKGTAGNHGGNIYVKDIFKMQGGTIADGVATSNGGNVFLGARGEKMDYRVIFVMSDGVIEDGRANGVKINQGGGNVYVNTKTGFEMTGGTIRGGKALGSYIDEKSKETKYVGTGGNVLVYGSESMFQMSGGAIASGQCVAQGGNVSIRSNGSFAMSGGSLNKGLSNNKAKSGTGGNLALIGGNVSISGGTIEDGSANNAKSANVYINNIAGNKFCMSGGNIDGQAWINNVKGEVTFTGNPVIYNAKGKTNLSVTIGEDGTGIRMNVFKLDGANINITTDHQGYYFTNVNTDTSSKDAECIHIDKGYNVGYSTVNKQLYIGASAGCYCGGYGSVALEHECEELLWKEWTNPAGRPTSAGNYRLMTDVELTGTWAVSENSIINLDLNGHKITTKGSSGRIFVANNEGAVLNITDTSKNYEEQPGMLQWILKDRSEAGSILYMNGAATVNLWNGVLDGSKIENAVDGEGKAISGPVVNIAKGTFNMYGGTVIGGSTSGNGGSLVVGAAKTESVFSMYAGQIQGGTATTGGNIHVNAAGKMNLYGGTIIGGKAQTTVVDDKQQGGYGGNVSVAGELHVLGGNVADGTAAVNGGNVFLSSRNDTIGHKVVFKMSDGVIENGRANGTNTNQGGGNVFVNTYTGFEMSGGEIGSGKTLGSYTSYNEETKKDETKYVGTGGNVLVYGDESSFQMSGGTIANGKCVAQGGNVSVRGNGSFTMSGGKLDKGQSNNDAKSGMGGSLALLGGSVTISGGTIEGGSANTGTSSNVYINNTVGSNVFTMDDGEIKGKVLINGIEGVVTFTGSPVIYNEKDGKPDGAQLTATIGEEGTGIQMNIYELTEEANIWISSDKEGYFFASENEKTKSADVNQIHFVKGYNVGYSARNKQLYVGNQENCSCYCNGLGDTIEGHVHVDVVWKDWTDKTKLPPSGSYRLTVDVILSAQANVSANKTLNLDLNGHTITGSVVNKRIFGVSNEGAVLNIIDTSTSQAGKIIWGSDTTQVAGSVIFMQGNSVVNLWGGTLDGSTIKTALDSNDKVINGPVISVIKGIFNMYDGAIIGGTTGGNGGSVLVGGTGELNGTFNMYGGTISGGTADKGGNIYVNTAGTMNLYGGTISGGVSSSYGGNVHVNGGTFTMSGQSTLTSGESTNHRGGNLGVATGTATITGGIIDKGKSKYSAGKDIYVINNKTTDSFTMSGTTVDVAPMDQNGKGTFSYTEKE